MTGLDATFQFAMEEIQRQQKASFQSIELLKNQHEEWQATLDTLMSRLTSSLEEQSGSKALHASSSSAEMVSQSESGQVGTASRRVSVKKLHTDNFRHLPMLMEEVLLDENPSKGIPTSTWGKRLRLLTDFVDSTLFEYITGAIIFTNIIIIGIEADLSLKTGEPHWSQLVEQVFLIVYSIELLLRILGGGIRIFQSYWFLMDRADTAVGFCAFNNYH